VFGFVVGVHVGLDIKAQTGTATVNVLAVRIVCVRIVIHGLEKAVELEAEEVQDEGDGYPSSDDTNWSPLPDGRGGTSEEPEGDI